MCGLTGFQFKPGYTTQADATKMLVAICASYMDSRGGDSYGYLKRAVNGKMSIYRHLGRAIDSMDYARIVGANQLMMHTRKTTHGETTVENAHPFQIGHIIGAHNGIISNHTELNKKYDRLYPVDSQHIFANIAEGRSLSDLHGYGAITFVDTNEPGTLYLGRFNGGSLEVYGLGKGKDDTWGTVYASTDECLIRALRILRISHFRYNVDPDRLFCLYEGRYLYSDRVNLRAVGTSYATRSTTQGPYRPSARQSSVTSDIDYTKPMLGNFKPCKPCRRKIRDEGRDKFQSSLALCKSCYAEWQKQPTKDRYEKKSSSSSGQSTSQGASLTKSTSEDLCQMCEEGQAIRTAYQMRICGTCYDIVTDAEDIEDTQEVAKDLVQEARRLRIECEELAEARADAESSRGRGQLLLALGLPEDFPLVMCHLCNNKRLAQGFDPVNLCSTCWNAWHELHRDKRTLVENTFYARCKECGKVLPYRRPEDEPVCVMCEQEKGLGKPQAGAYSIPCEDCGQPSAAFVSRQRGGRKLLVCMDCGKPSVPLGRPAIGILPTEKEEEKETCQTTQLATSQ